MKKLFISCPMIDKTNDEIKEKRNEIKNKVEKFIGEEVELIDSFFENAPHNATPIWFLGQSILKLSEADIVCFGEYWEKYDGCFVEHEIANRYSKRVNINLQLLYEIDL